MECYEGIKYRLKGFKRKFEFKRKENIMEGNYFDCSNCRYRYIHFPNMDDYEISMQECLCDGEYYEEEQ